jgi:hypothetical protein
VSGQPRSGSIPTDNSKAADSSSKPADSSKTADSSKKTDAPSSSKKTADTPSSFGSTDAKDWSDMFAGQPKKLAKSSDFFTELLEDLEHQAHAVNREFLHDLEAEKESYRRCVCVDRQGKEMKCVVGEGGCLGKGVHQAHAVNREFLQGLEQEKEAYRR